MTKRDKQAIVGGTETVESVEKLCDSEDDDDE